MINCTKKLQNNKLKKDNTVYKKTVYMYKNFTEIETQMTSKQIRYSFTLSSDKCEMRWQTFYIPYIEKNKDIL